MWVETKSKYKPFTEQGKPDLEPHKCGSGFPDQHPTYELQVKMRVGKKVISGLGLQVNLRFCHFSWKNTSSWERICRLILNKI